MHFQGTLGPSGFPGDPNNQLASVYPDYPSSFPAYDESMTFDGLWLGPPYVPAFVGPMKLQLNAPHGALIPVLWDDGTPVQGSDLATTQITLSGRYNALSNSWVLYSVRPILDSVMREQALQAEMLVECAWGGNLLQALDVAGERVASVFAATETAGFEATKAIDGSRVPKDYANDLPDNYWRSPHTNFGTPAWGIFDLGLQRDFNSVVVYQHPTLPQFNNSLSRAYPVASIYQYMIYGRNTAPSAAEPTLASGWSIVGACYGAVKYQLDPSGELFVPSKLETKFPNAASFRYLGIKAVLSAGLSSPESDLRFCEIEVYNWVDESSRVIFQKGTGPMVEIEKTLDSSQTALATPSECRITLVNEDGRFTPANSSSPIYGDTQVDGRGSGIRAGVLVRVEARVMGADRILRGRRRFDGLIANDEGVGGALAIQLDENSKQALLVCKGFATFLDQDQDSPVYEGMFFSPLISDLFNRSQMASQDIIQRDIWQGVPFVSFDRQGAMKCVQAMAQGLPFLRVFERHSPEGAIEVRNRGRSRADFSFDRFDGETRNNTLNNVPDLYSLYAVNISRDSNIPFCTTRMLHNGDNHYFWRNTCMRVVGRGSGTSPTPQVDYTRMLGSPRVYRWNETGPVGDSNLAADSYNHNGSFYNKLSQWATIIAGTMYEITSNWMIGSYEGPRMRSAPLAADGTLTFSTLGTIGLTDPQFEGLVSAISHGSFIYFVTFRPTAGQFNNFQNAFRFYVWDVNTGFATRSNKGLDSAVGMDLRHLMVDDNYLAYTQFTQSTALRIWNHGGTPTTTPLSFVTRNFFSFGTIGPDGANYADTSVPRCRYFLSDDGYLYCAAQPRKVNNLYRYEVWRVLMSDFEAGTATGTLLGILADDIADDISDLVVKDQVVYVLDRTSLWTWNVTKDISRKFDLGTAFQHVPSKRKDSGYNTTSNNPAYIPPPFFNGVLGRSRPYFMHQGTFEVQNNRIINGSASRGFGWCNRHTDCGPETPAFDEKGRVWIVLGELAGGTNFSSELRAFSISQGQFDETPIANFDITDGFTRTMKIPDGSPQANVIKMDVNPFRLDPNVSDVWTQQNEDPVTFPAGQLTTVEIMMNTISARGAGNATGTHRYLRINGTNIFDNPLAGVSVTLENVARTITFWALGRKAFVTVDNVGKPGCTVSGMVIRAKPIVPRFSSSVVIEAKSEASIRVYKGRKYFLDLTNEFANDPTFTRDLLLAYQFVRLWGETIELPWYPLIEPGDIVTLTNPAEGANGEAFEVSKVSERGFTTVISGKQVPASFVI